MKTEHFRRLNQLSFSFLTIVLPYTNQALRKLTAQRKTGSSNPDEVSAQVEWTLAHVFDKEINTLRKVELLKMDLMKCEEFVPHEVFRILDDERYGGITPAKLSEFLTRNRVTVKEEEIKALMRKIDMDMDGKVSYVEFLNAVTPLGEESRYNDIRELIHTSAGMSVKDKVRNYYTPERIRGENDLQKSTPTTAASMSKSTPNTMKERVRTEINVQELTPKAISSLSSSLKKSGTTPKRLIKEARTKTKTKSELPQGFIVNNNDNNQNPTDNNATEKMDITTKPRPFEMILSYGGETDNMLSRSYNGGYGNKKESRHSAVSFNLPAERSTAVTDRARDYGYSMKDSKEIQSPDRVQHLTTPDQGPFYTQEEATTDRPTRLHARRDNRDARDSAYMARVHLTPSPIRGASPRMRRSPKSPMKGNEEEHLVNAFKAQLDMDKDLEGVRIELALKADYNLMDAFRFFDVTGKGYITSTELEDAMRYFDVYPNNLELYLVMRRFDADGDGLLKFSDFCSMMTPRDPDYARLLAKRPPSYAEDNILYNLFEDKTLRIVSKLLNAIVQNEVQSENLRQRLARRPLFNIIDAFKTLDIHEKGYATPEDIRELLIAHRIYVSGNDVFTLIKRYDKLDQGKISFTEFIKEISPKSPQKL